MSKGRGKIAALVIMCVMLLGIGTTLAYYTSSQTAVNKLKTADSGLELVEKFKPDSSFLPGESVEKVVSFKNSKDTQLLLRVKAEWKGFADTDFRIVTDLQTKTELRDDLLTLNWADDIADNWTLIGGYYYYNKILEAEESTAPIFEKISFYIEDENGEKQVADNDFMNRTWELKFTAEGIPVHGILWEGLQFEIGDDQQTVTWTTKNN